MALLLVSPLRQTPTLHVFGPGTVCIGCVPVCKIGQSLVEVVLLIYS